MHAFGFLSPTIYTLGTSLGHSCEFFILAQTMKGLLHNDGASPDSDDGAGAILFEQKRVEHRGKVMNGDDDKQSESSDAEEERDSEMEDEKLL